MPLELYSNNLGVYGVHGSFTIVPSASVNTLRAASDAKQNVAGAAKRTIKLVAPVRVYVDDDVFVHTLLTSQEAASDRLRISYYEGNPNKDGALFDVQRIHHIAGNSTLTHTSFFQPQTCGNHTLYAQLSIDSSQTLTAGPKTVVVIANPVPMTEEMLVRLKGVKLSAQAIGGLRSHLEQAHNFFKQKHTEEGIVLSRVSRRSPIRLKQVPMARVRSCLRVLPTKRTSSTTARNCRRTTRLTRI